MRIFGFSLIRNGVQYDFPFVESLKSLQPLVETIYLAVAKSDDSTEAVVADLDFVQVIPTIWDDKHKAEGGQILSQQTNIALNEARKRHSAKDDWGIYLQADEVLLESEYDQLRADISEANANGYDAISLRYIHFWQHPDQFAFRKRWYPQEIRIVKLSSKIESWGDAQSFRNCQKTFESNVSVFHYGHVREPEAYKEKMRAVMDWWHKADEITRMYKRNKRRDVYERTLNYLGPHPRTMQKRVNSFLQRYGRTVAPISRSEARVIIVGGDRTSLSERFLSGIRADSVDFVKSLFHVPVLDWKFVVFLEPRPLEQFLSKNSSPKCMLSERARPWPASFYLSVQLWRKGICTEYLQ